MPKKQPTKYIESKHYNGEATVRFYPNSHRYYVDDPKKKRHNERLMGTTTVTGILDKSGSLMDWTVSEAMKLVFGMKREKQDTGAWEFVIDATRGAIVPGKQYTAEELRDIMIRAKTAYKKKQTRGKDVGSQAHEWLERYLKAFRDGEKLPTPIEIDFDPENEVEVDQASNLQESMKEFTDWFNAQKIDEILGIEYLVYSREQGYCGTFDSLMTINGKTYLIDFKTSNSSWEYPNGVYPEYMAQLAGYDEALCEEFPEYNDKIDGYMVWNASKQKPMFVAQALEHRDMARKWFEACYGAKKGSQFFTRKMSKKYTENK